MADNAAASSRSRRRRSRANRRSAAAMRKPPENSCSVEQVQTDTSGTSASGASPTEAANPIPEATTMLPETQQSYRVESPVERRRAPIAAKPKATMAKSKSLDDMDEDLKITELSEGEDDKSYPVVASGVAIVAEVDSDIEWETADELIITDETLKRMGTMSTLTLALGENMSSDQVPLISPEDELSLRNFLEGLNLVSSPEDAIKITHEKASAESIKAKRANKRAALEQHFLPMYKHPRYLDVINEENSDQSDREQQNRMKHKAFDESEASTSRFVDYRDWDEYDDDDDDVFMDEKKIPKKMQTKIVSCVTQIRSEPLHFIKSNVIQDSSWSRGVAEFSSGAEVVYLDDSSNSRTPSEIADADGSQDADEEDEEERDQEQDAIENPEIDLKTVSVDNESKYSENERLTTLPLSQLTPPPTPDSISPKNEICTVAHVFSTSTDSKLEAIEKVKQIPSEHTVPIDCTVVNRSECEENRTSPIPEVQKCVIEIRDVPETDNKECTTSTESSSESNDRIDTNSSPVASTTGSMSSDCSSRSTSQSTVRHNPEPVGDIMSLLRDEEEALKNMLLSQPLMLKEICLKKVISLPFGAAMLEELAEVSSLIDDMTSNVSSHSTVTHSKYSSILVKDEDLLPFTNVSFILPDSPNQNPSDAMWSLNIDGGTKWVGLPTDQDPSVLVCLSPSQRDYMESGRSVPDEADKLLDLHRKFIDRRGYHERTQIPPTCSHTARKSAMSKAENAGNRLLAIIRDTSRPDAAEVRAASYTSARGEMPLAATEHREIIHKIKLEETAPEARAAEARYAQMSNKNNTSATLPRVKRDEDSFRSKYDRLRARDLNEWLQLARGHNTREQTQQYASVVKPRTETTAPRRSDIPQVSTNNRDGEAFKKCDKMQGNAVRCSSLPRCPKITADDVTSTTTTTSTTTRRFSLPHQVHERQMQYILQKEREIELEIQNLEAEKRRLSQEMDEDYEIGRQHFEPNQYYISRRGDIAIRNDANGENKAEKIRPRSMPLAPSEFFRQTMYDEYMRKVAAREDRKYHKVIKISSRPTSLVSEESVESSSYTIQQAKGIENEFMDRVKERMGKLGMNAEDLSDARQTDQSENDEEQPPVLIIDGESVTGRKKLLPKHLQEFIDIARFADDDFDEEGEDGEWIITIGFGFLSLLLCAFWWNNNSVFKALNIHS